MKLSSVLTQLNLANQLTFLRLVAIPFFVIAVVQGRFVVAFALFIGAAITDILDGLTARWLDQGTPLGALLDPDADKLLLTAAFVLLTDWPSMFSSIPMVARIPVWLTILVISRDVIIVLVALVLSLASRDARFPPSLFGKVTTFAVSVTVGAFLAANAWHRHPAALDVLVWITLALILLSGFHYLGRTVASIRPAGDGGSPT